MLILGIYLLIGLIIATVTVMKFLIQFYLEKNPRITFFDKIWLSSIVFFFGMTFMWLPGWLFFTWLDWDVKRQQKILLKNLKRE